MTQDKETDAGGLPHDSALEGQQAASRTPLKQEQDQVKQKGRAKLATAVDHDPFVLEAMFPDVSSILTIPPAINEIAKQCIFILDANSLLVPYEVGQESLKDLSQIYKRLTDDGRLFVAARALREYARHRADKIKEVYYKLTEMSKRSQPLELLKAPLLEGTTTYKEMLKSRTDANSAISSYDKKRQELAEEVRNWNRNDEVSKLYSAVFAKRILDHSTPKEELLEDVKWRSTHRIPPGFHDADKPDLGIGDVHIWHTILKASLDNNKDVIFVSNDEKNDWMVRVNKEALFTRSELVDEFNRKTKHHFASISFRRFVELVGAAVGTVTEVKETLRAPIGSVPGDPDQLPIKEVLARIDSLVAEFVDRADEPTGPVYLRSKAFRPLVVRFIQGWRSQFSDLKGEGDERDLVLLEVLLSDMLRLSDELAFQFINPAAFASSSSSSSTSAGQYSRLLELCSRYLELRQGDGYPP